MRFPRSLERCQLRRCRLFLVLLLPARERFAVDALARGVLVHFDAARFGGFAVPVGKAVAAEARCDHKIDVLHVGTLVQMREQAPERGGLEFGIAIDHGPSPLCPMLAHAPVPITALGFEMRGSSMDNAAFPIGLFDDRTAARWQAYPR